MRYHLACSHTEEHVRVTVSGTWESTDAREIFARILQEWQQYRTPALLIDTRTLMDTPKPLEDYENVKELVTAGFAVVQKIAVLDQGARRRTNDLFSLFANNRGLHLRFFYGDEQEALDWIEMKEGTKHD